MIRSDLALAALATAAVPGMRPVQVAGIRTSEETPLHQSALVEDVTGRKWLVRAPLGAAAGAELERNDDLIRQLGKHLPFKVPAAAGYADLGQDGRAAVYPYVEGQGLSLRHLPVGPGLTNAVGRALAAIHNMPRELFEEHGVPIFDAAEFRARKLTELDRAAETGHVPNGLLARWEQALDADVMWQFTTVPTHGSLDGASFLVVFSEDDAASGRVVGIDGWERAQVADPAEDFARLVQQSHPHAVDAVFESYSMARGARPDGYLLNRARLASETRLLGGLVAALGADDQAFVRTRADQLRKLDRLTANDNSLVPRTAVAPTGPAVDEDSAPTEPTVDEDSAPTEPTVDEDSAPSEPTVDGESTATEHRADSEAADRPASDATATVPVPVALDDEDEDDEPAFVVEQPAEGVHLEPVRAAGSEADDDTNQFGDDPVADDSPAVLAHELDWPDASPTDVTAPIPMFRPIQSAPPEQSTPDPAAPDPTEAEPDERAADEVEPDEHVDERDAEPGEDEGTEAAASTDERAAEDQEQERAAEDQEQERLHTLYGMPDEDELESDQR
ncbi:phosphotransferase [Ornithinimicrobium faecis]|uniref:phosphotransferase n=1 Tax=Ornithinimicrobium faecis TaxID=2934158 RepID=UPI00211983A0|nr:phosphotransferase [Ornithinimicrobium sp. HY1745]